MPWRADYIAWGAVLESILNCFAASRDNLEDYSSISVTTVFYSENEDRISQIVEADAVVARAKTELGRLDFLEALYVALACGQIARKNTQNA